MFSLNSNKSYILEAFEKGMKWVKNNTVDGGVIHSSTLRKPYPEVAGYYIPSLLQWGERELAVTYGNWLLSIQTPEGAWPELQLKTPYTFDTGQILKGLFELIPYGQEYEAAFLKGCDWLLKQIDSEGRIHTPETSLFANMGNEYIHLYALEPLKKAGEKYGRQDYLEGVSRALNYYLQKDTLTDFNILTHFHAYIIEALIDLGQEDKALQALRLIQTYQRSNGAIPAFSNVNWTCLVAMLQYAVCFYKLKMLKEGNTLLDYVIKRQQPSGGFYGGDGWFVTYFKNIEIGWANKYLLDAIHLRLKLEFIENDRAESFLGEIAKSDGRYVLLKEMVGLSPTQHLPHIKILDVGCGKGRFIHNLLSEGFKGPITALDISDVLFKYLPKECEKKVGNICQLPFDDEQFDYVFCCEVLERAVNIETAVKELARVCKPGGTVLVIDKDSSRQKKVRLEAWEQWFDKQKLKELMESKDLATTIKELTTTDGPNIYAWIGKK